MTLCLVMLCMQEPIDTDNTTEICAKADQGMSIPKRNLSVVNMGCSRKVCILVAVLDCAEMCKLCK